MKKIKTGLLFVLFAASAVSGWTQQLPKMEIEQIKRYFERNGQAEYLELPKYNQTLVATFASETDSTFLLDFLKRYTDSLNVYSSLPDPTHELLKSLYAIDFNGDRKMDVIYQGPTGGEQTVTQFFLNKGTAFEKVFEAFQYIIYMRFDNNRLASFVLYNPGCCADPQQLEYYYNMKYTPQKIQFEHYKTDGYLWQTEKPNIVYNNFKQLKIKAPIAILRKECYILDNVEHPVNGTNGNQIATYKTGAKGTLLGAKTVDNEEWIYVRMEPDAHMLNCEFSSFTEQPTLVTGWMLKNETNLQ